jgi:catalase
MTTRTPHEREVLGRTLVEATKRDFTDWESGTRAAHSHGIGAIGFFEASDVARNWCSAKHFTGERIPVVVRFSNGSGERTEADRATDARGMAVKFFAGTEHETDLIAMSLPVFFVSDPASFLQFSEIGVPTPRPGPPGRLERLRNSLRLTPTPKPSPYDTPMGPSSKALVAFANRHRESRGPVAALGNLVTPASYARCAYHGVHSFVLRDADAHATTIRYSWWPVAGVRAADRTTAGLPENYLHDELRERLASGPFEFTLQFLVAEHGDRVDDPTVALDHAHRPRIIAGRLVVTDLFENGDGAERLSFNPTRLIPGFEASDDRILAARGEAYEVSCRDREGTGCPVVH